MKLSLSLIVILLFVAYIGQTMWTMYRMFYPPTCLPTVSKTECWQPLLRENPKYALKVYTATEHSIRSQTKWDHIWTWKLFDPFAEHTQDVNISLPTKTKKNGTLYAIVALEPYDRSSQPIRMQTFLTTYMIPAPETFSLLGGNTTEGNPKFKSTDRPITHFRTHLYISVMSDIIGFPRKNLPPEISGYLRIDPATNLYVPILYIDEFSYRIKELTPVQPDTDEVPLHIICRPISIGRLRLMLNMAESIKQLMSLGFSEKDVDEVKGIFIDTSFYLLLLTIFVSSFHLLFDILAFKNDISFWRNKKDMVGMSLRTVVWRCVSTFIIFLFLLDEGTSLLVLIPAAISAIIEVWKVKRAFKVSIKWSGFIPKFEFGSSSKQEAASEEIDSQAMTYLTYLLWPLCIAGAVYSLLYTPHKNWYSWCINCLVNGIYAFGFLFMLPQLFLNYKLKSVAHLPWRAFMYKAFNTFIDDIFAFIITMPTAHRVACFRDDVVFLIYLYQRWLYPVDKTRVNEYGQSFDEQKKEDKKTK